MKKKMLLPIGRCNKCMWYYHEEVDECLSCMSDKYLMDMPEIVKAVNMHDELINAMNTVSEQLKLIERNQRIITRDMYLILDNAIAKAKGA